MWAASSATLFVQSIVCAWAQICAMPPKQHIRTEALHFHTWAGNSATLSVQSINRAWAQICTRLHAYKV